MDSAFYARKTVGARRRAAARFSVSARMDAEVARTAPGYRAARAATIRTRLVNVAARLAHRARAIHLHLPERWPWQHAWDNLFTAVHPPPA